MMQPRPIARFRFLSYLLVAGAFSLASSRAGAAPETKQPLNLIVIDGRFDDWSAADTIIVDLRDAPDSAVDFGAIACRADGQFVHLRIDLGREVNIQHLRGRGLIVLDADNDSKTGLTQFGLEGADFIVELTPPAREPGRPGMGFGLRSTTFNPDPADATVPALIPYDMGITFAPTHAGDQTEIRIERGARLANSPPAFEGDSFRAKLLFLDESKLIRDETATFACPLPARSQPQIEQPTDPLARDQNATVRIVNWNVEFGAIFQKPDLFGRVLRAIDPDVIHLEELSAEHTAEELRAVLNAKLPATNGRGDWNVLWGEGGGDLRCGIASRFPLSPVDPLRLVAFPNFPDRFVRVAAATAEIDNRRVLLIALHLKCCGYAGSTEDIARIEEVALVRNAISRIAPPDSFDAIIISGDLNLVGSRTPLDRFAERVNDRIGPLTVVPTMQIDGRSNATWSDPDQPFVPGRLDYFLFGGPNLKLGRSFCFDSRDLSAAWLGKHAIVLTDTAEASDHLPIVADFAFAPMQR